MVNKRDRNCGDSCAGREEFATEAPLFSKPSPTGFERGPVLNELFGTRVEDVIVLPGIPNKPVKALLRN